MKTNIITDAQLTEMSVNHELKNPYHYFSEEKLRELSTRSIAIAREAKVPFWITSTRGYMPVDGGFVSFVGDAPLMHVTSNHPVQTAIREAKARLGFA